MEIKRNMFDSSAKMPPRYEPCATAMCQDYTTNPPMVGLPRTNSSVMHAPIPRIGAK